MKINIKDNNQWIADETKKRKKRITILVTLILLMVAALGGSVLYTNHAIKTGKIYPTIILQEAPGEGMPSVQTTVGYEKVVKTPTLPFTMTVKGDVVSEGESFCTLLTEGDYISICEIAPSIATKTYIKDSLIPSLGAQSIEAATFHEQRGYLNNRYVETEADTITIGKNSRLYCMSYRLIISSTADILITGISSDIETEELNNKLQNIFYSIYQLADTTIEETTAEIENISTNEKVQEYPGTDIDMDQDYVINKSEPINTKLHQNHLYEIDEKKLYKSNEEKVVTVETEIDEAVFLFSYQRNVKLKDIKLYDPEGKEYNYTEYTDDFSPMYAFFINTPMLGDWKFVYTVPDEHIGMFRGQILSKQNYIDSTKPVKSVQRDNE